MIHHVFANRSNIGDWLSALGIQALLQPQTVREHLCDEPFVEETLEDLARARAEDRIVVGGGGLLMEYFTPLWEGLRNLVDRVPVSVWGVGYCDLKLEPSRPPVGLLEEVLGKCSPCQVRDEVSRRHLSRLNLPTPVPCPSICVVARPDREGRGLLHVDNYTTVGGDAYEIMEAEGRAFAEGTGRPFRKTNNRIRDGSRRELEETLERYRSSDLVLSSALHGCIIGVAMGRKVLAVSGDHKIEGFMEAAGLGEWVLDLEEVHLIPERLGDLSGQSPPWTFLEDARRANQAVAEEVLRSQHGGYRGRRSS